MILRLRWGRRWTAGGRRLGVFAVVLLAIAGNLGSENLVLSTRYPPAAAIHQNLYSTGNTYLATSSGRVGINTTAPDAKFDVAGAMALKANRFYVSGASNNAYIGRSQRLAILGTVGFFAGANADPKENEHITMNLKGQIGIGKTDPWTPPGSNTNVLLVVRGIIVPNGEFNTGAVLCPGGTYKTYLPGVYGQVVNSGATAALCMSCVGTCPTP